MLVPCDISVLTTIHLPNAAVQFELGFGCEGPNLCCSSMECSCAKGYTGTTFPMCLHVTILLVFYV